MHCHVYFTHSTFLSSIILLFLSLENLNVITDIFFFHFLSTNQKNNMKFSSFLHGNFVIIRELFFIFLLIITGFNKNVTDDNDSFFFGEHSEHTGRALMSLNIFYLFSGVYLFLSSFLFLRPLTQFFFSFCHMCPKCRIYIRESFLLYFHIL